MVEMGFSSIIQAVIQSLLKAGTDVGDFIKNGCSSTIEVVSKSLLKAGTAVGGLVKTVCLLIFSVLTKLLLIAGILLGCFIVAKIAVKLVPLCLQSLRDWRRNRNWQPRNRREVPKRRDVEEGAETRPPFSAVASKKTLDSGTQHNRSQFSSAQFNSETAHQKNYGKLPHQLPASCKPSSPSLQLYQPLIDPIPYVAPSQSRVLYNSFAESKTTPDLIDPIPYVAPSQSRVLYNSFAESKTTPDSGIQHDKSPFSPVLVKSETAHQKNDQKQESIFTISRPLTKPTLRVVPSDPANPQAKTSYISAHEDGTLPIYAIPEDINELIKKDVVPRVLKKPVSPSTYKDYFGALLYAEDYYIEKWNGFEMKNVALEMHEAAIYKRKGKYNRNMNNKKEDKVFVEFELDSIPERRPFLLSRDFVFVRPSGEKVEPFQGVLYRVERRNHVLVEFGDDFHHQHDSECEYDVKFSFNRVCLKRAHQAIAAVSASLFRNFLFPDFLPKSSLVAARFEFMNPTLDRDQVFAVRRILSHKNPPPYLVEGQLSVDSSKKLSRTGLVVCEVVRQIYRTHPSCRILICAPTNSTCDVITRKSKEEIPEYDIFRANAAFRELDGVPLDILPTCSYVGECFDCPSLQELRNFKVILCTFMSSFRLQNEGIMAGHFSHIFLVDASSVTEPEALVPLANFANGETTVTVTGAPGNRSGWIRSDIARRNGLMTSYFERLRDSMLYESLDSNVITVL